MTKTLHREGKKHFKVRNSWGMFDAFRLTRKNGWYSIGHSVKREIYFAIIRRINKLLAHEIACGREVVFPCRMGYIELNKRADCAKMVNGKLKVTYPVDWRKTLELWYNDKEAEKNKVLIRKEQPFTYKTKYNNFRATYNNKAFYSFTLNRYIKLALKDNINQGKVETEW